MNPQKKKAALATLFALFREWRHTPDMMEVKQSTLLGWAQEQGLISPAEWFYLSADQPPTTQAA